MPRPLPLLKPVIQKPIHRPQISILSKDGPQVLIMDAHQKKVRAARKASPKSDYDRTLSKSIEEAKKTMKRAGKGVPQLGEQEKQSVPDLVVGNEYGTNMDIIQRTYGDRKSTRLNSSHVALSRMPSSA